MGLCPEKNMKKMIAMALSVCMSASVLMACGSSAEKATDTSAAPAAEATAGTANMKAETTVEGAGKATTLKMAISASEKSIQGLTGNYWSELCKEGRDKGETTVDIVLYPNNQLGKVSEVLEQLAMGENVIVATDAGTLKSYAPDLGILDGPYFFDNEEDVEKLFDTQWFEEQCNALYEKGIKVVNATMVYGTREIMAKTPIKTPADMKGVKLRVPSNDLSTSIIEAMGGVPTAMSLSDVYASIQQGVVDGMENPIATHVDSSMWEVCDYLSRTGHQITITWYVMSAQSYDALSDTDKEFLMSSAEDSAAFFNETNGGMNKEGLQTLIDKGVTVVDDVDVAVFKEATTSVYDKFGWTELKQEIYKQMGK